LLLFLLLLLHLPSEVSHQLEFDRNPGRIHNDSASLLPVFSPRNCHHRTPLVRSTIRIEAIAVILLLLLSIRG
jgi:hypothetical protein